MKKIGLICLAVVLAVGLLGVGYAHWDDQLYINGTVQAGEFIFGILKDSVTTGDNEDQNVPIKEVGDCTATLSEFETSVHHEPGVVVGKLLTFTVTDVYPCYELYINFSLKNAGTVPACINGVHIYDPNGELEYDPARGALVKAGGSPEVINITFTTKDGGDWVVGKQIDPCQEVPVMLSLHFKQATPECAAYMLTIHIVAVQWNKVPLDDVDS